MMSIELLHIKALGQLLNMLINMVQINEPNNTIVPNPFSANSPFCKTHAQNGLEHNSQVFPRNSRSSSSSEPNRYFIF